MGTKKDKTILYYKITLKKAITHEDVTCQIKSIFNAIFEKNAYNAEPASLQLEKGEESVTMDILVDNEDFLFARVGKAKNNSEIQIRNKGDHTRQDVFDSVEIQSKAIEVCTYFLLDYKNGIIDFIIGQSAPQVNVVLNIINYYDTNYEIDIQPILDPEGVKQLLKPGSSITKIKYSYAVPHAAILGKIGVPETVLLELEDELEVELVIKSRYNTPLGIKKNQIGNIIEGFKQVKNRYKKLALEGKSEGKPAKDFKFESKKLDYSIKIDLIKVNSGIKRAYTTTEIAEIIYEKLKEIHNENIVEILLHAGRCD